MPCRNDPDDPRKCERCGAFLWVADEGLYCGECGGVMPCSMRLLPLPPTVAPAPDPRSSVRAAGEAPAPGP